MPAAWASGVLRLYEPKLQIFLSPSKLRFCDCKQMLAKQLHWFDPNCSSNRFYCTLDEEVLWGGESSTDCKLISWTGPIVMEEIVGHSQNGLNMAKRIPYENISEVPSLDQATNLLDRVDTLSSIENFIHIIQDCRNEKNFAYAKKLHKHARDHGLDTHKSIGNYLIPMLVDCGNVLDAEQVLEKMQENGIHPNRYALHALLRASAQLRFVARGQELHAEVAKEGFQREPFVGSTLVDMYAKCGALSEAQDVFDELLVRDVVSWTALISGYSEHGYGEEALDCFNKMQLEGLSPDAVTFLCSLKACISLKSRERGRKMHIEIVKEGFERNSFISSMLVDMYAKCGSLVEAKQVLEEHSLRDINSWTSLMAGFTEYGYAEEALICLKRMQLEGVALDAFTCVCSLKACGMTGALHRGQETHYEIVKEEFESDPFIGSILVDMYAKCGSLEEAQEVFEEMPVQARNVVSWTALITGYAENGHSEDALECLEQMQLMGISPNAITIVCSLKACSNIGAIDKGRELHVETVKEGFESGDSICTTLVDMYARCGSLLEAWDVFNDYDVQDAVSWNALIAGYARQGESEPVFCLFERMMEKGIQPQTVTLLSVLTVCSHGGLVDKGKKLFEDLMGAFNLPPSLEHCNCMIDLFGRAGQCDLAMEMLDKMPFHPDIVTWKTILSACQKWGDVDLGKQIFRQVLTLHGDQPAAFTLMSNIFADAHMWEHLECDFSTSIYVDITHVRNFSTGKV